MIDILKTVKEAVATKNLISILTHLHFYDGRVQANNGRLCIDAPLDIGYEVTVPAVKFMQASRLCSSKIKLNLTKMGKLTVSCNKFRAILQTAEHDNYPRMSIDLQDVQECEHLLRFIQPLVPFISEDASRPWSMGILIRGGYAWATNNVVIARVEVPFTWEAVIPKHAIMALLSIDGKPNFIGIKENYVAFLYEDNIWMRCATVTQKWPDVSKLVVQTQAQAVPAYFSDTLDAMKAFCEDPKIPIFLLGSYGIKTNTDEQGATVELAQFPDSKFRAEPLMQVAGIATHIDFSSYPKPCYFKSSIGVDGVIIGVL